MEYRKLGDKGPEVSALGLGAMGMSPGLYGEVDDGESIATIQYALDLGVTLIDTANIYGEGHNER
ncbi:MAG TPA: aldo/keto reductase, partial [Rubrobacteraceae bacterium]|nr:aldo/keto reductase [Rubrobacteraceae bacterium]